MAKIYALYGKEDKLVATFTNLEIATSALVDLNFIVGNQPVPCELRTFVHLTKKQIEILSFAQAVGIEQILRHSLNDTVINPL